MTSICILLQNSPVLIQDSHYPNGDSLLTHRKLLLRGSDGKEGVKLTVFNPVGYQRSVLVKLSVDIASVKVSIV